MNPRSSQRIVLCSAMIFLSIHFAGTQEATLMPVIDGEWWTVAGDPDLGEYTDPKQQPVDFGVWQAADGTWQLWSCIRHTKCGGHTRLFHRWQSENLTDTNWEPMGIAMEADPGFGESPGGLQAPHVLYLEGRYYMFYGDWEHICLAKGMDGKTFARQLMPDGNSGMFTEGIGNNTRDPMVVQVGYSFYCYYTAMPNKKGAVYCRVSKDLRNWSESKIVAFGGRAGSNAWSAECPHVVYFWEREEFYLFRTQRYGENPQTSVYRSKSPFDFGINDDRYFVCTLPVAAPEIIHHDEKFYIASLRDDLKGIKIARLKWLPKE